MRVRLCPWATGGGLPRGIATRELVLRSGPDLGSTVIGRLPTGGHAFVMETIELPLVPMHETGRPVTSGFAEEAFAEEATPHAQQDGTILKCVRALVAASTAAPLGWITSSKEVVRAEAGGTVHESFLVLHATSLQDHATRKLEFSGTPFLGSPRLRTLPRAITTAVHKSTGAVNNVVHAYRHTEHARGPLSFGWLGTQKHQKARAVAPAKAGARAREVKL